MDEVTEIFCENFRRVWEKQKQSGLSQQAFARRIGVAQKSISHVLHAIELNRAIRSDTMAAIAAGLGVPLWKMLIPSIPLDLLHSPLLEDLIKHYAAAGSTGREYVARIAEREAAYETNPAKKP